MKLVDFLKHLFGISGHNATRATVIAAVAEESTRESRELNEQLVKYKKHADPFGALMVDLYNRRAEHLLAKSPATNSQ